MVEAVRQSAINPGVLTRADLDALLRQRGVQDLVAGRGALGHMHPDVRVAPARAEHQPGLALQFAVAAVHRAPGRQRATRLPQPVGMYACQRASQAVDDGVHGEDFEPVALIGSIPNVMVVHPSVPAQNVQELIKLAKADPQKYAYASSGVATPLHLSGEMFNRMAGTQMPHVPYRGAAPAIASR